MIEERRATMVVNKGGSGGSTFRATLPTLWIRKMGLSEDVRDLRLIFDGERIIIESLKEETEMLEKLLETAKSEIVKEMDRVGFIDDSDNTDRFLDGLARELVEEESGSNDDGEIEELTDELLEMIQDYMHTEYKSEGETDERGNYSGRWIREVIK